LVVVVVHQEAQTHHPVDQVVVVQVVQLWEFLQLMAVQAHRGKVILVAMELIHLHFMEEVVVVLVQSAHHH
jgi:hypothetical protein